MKNFVERKACPACYQKSEQLTVYKKSYSDDKIRDFLTDFYEKQGKIDYDLINHAIFEVIECNVCNLIYQKNIPDDFLLSKVYEEWISPAMAKKKHILRLKSNHDTVRLNNEINIAKSFFPKTKNLKFYDFGMGWSQFLILAKERGIDCYGSELSKERIDYAVSQGIKVIDIKHLSNYKFDYIHTQQVFEHLANPREILLKLVSSLKVGGILFISVPNGSKIKVALDNDKWNPRISKSTRMSINPISPLEHLNCFNFSSLVSFAEMYGLTRIKPNLSAYYKGNLNLINPIKNYRKLLQPIALNFLNLFPSLYFIKNS